jgi:hypothetical protein
MRGLFIRLRDLFGTISDRVIVDGGELSRRFGAALTAPFKRTAWTIQERLVWPVSDRLPRPSGAVRALSVITLVVGAGIATLLLAGANGSGGLKVAEVASQVAPSARSVPPPPKAPPAPTLAGATPVFKSAAKKEQPAGSTAKQVKSAPAEPAAAGSSSTADSSSPATDKISSTPAAETSSVPSVPTTPETSATPALPAGPAAIAVAHRFADAFVVYETGGVEASVRDAFGKTATPQLSRALLRRPPRLPANVEVPRAKVLNVVAAPSRGPVYPISVSLLRLGVTSELRLSMEQKKKDGWRVSDVLG